MLITHFDKQGCGQERFEIMNAYARKCFDQLTEYKSVYESIPNSMEEEIKRLRQELEMEKARSQRILETVTNNSKFIITAFQDHLKECCPDKFTET